MDDVKKTQALEVLNYWKTMEFLSQVDIPKNKKNNSRRSGNKIELFHSIKNASIDVEKEIVEDSYNQKYNSYPAIGQELYFCVGEIKRELIFHFFEQQENIHKEEKVEKSFHNSQIAWFSFKTDTTGTYIKNSFQLSPVLWAISEWSKFNTSISLIFSLDINKYDQYVLEMNNSLENQNVSDFLEDLYNDIEKQYILPYFPDKKWDFFYSILIYNRYKNEKVRDNDDEINDYSKLVNSFFIKDIVKLIDLINNNDFGNKNAYEKQVINYILAGYEKSKKINNIERFNISPNENSAKMQVFFENQLNIKNAPMGKWPSKYMPVLMQQLAINIAIKQDENVPIFSVNGPPGTGKTTMLKEIIANNIVKRAYLLAQNGNDPDSLFKEHSFDYGPIYESEKSCYNKHAPSYYSIKNDEINNYIILVASSNNTAVENITADLPKEKDILEGLSTSNDDEEDVKLGLNKIHDLCDIKKSEDEETFICQDQTAKTEKDIYFTRYANRLFLTNCWGLISAPLGKRINKENYYKNVLQPFIFDYISMDTRKEHKIKYINIREQFLKQYTIVENLKADLQQICELEKTIPIDMFQMSTEQIPQELKTIEEQKNALIAELRRDQTELMDLEEHRPKKSLKKTLTKLFSHSSEQENLSTRDMLIKEKKTKIDSTNKKVEELNSQRSKIEKLQDYYKRIAMYSKGEKKMSPLDKSFIDNYISDDKVLSTNAQTMNPWFTAQYNREREKLFLYACKLHKEFVISSECIRQNIINLSIAWNMFNDSERMHPKDKKAAMPYLMQSLFLFTPVISTTFASVQTLFNEIDKSGILGTLIIDEAGQATPQMAIGALFRCRKAIVVGDPRQIEPVVTDETEMFKQLINSEILSGYKNKSNSVQGFADYINPYGTLLEGEWIGCPLLVHRRCIDPMYTISNTISYGNTMRQQTDPPKKEKEKTFILDQSYWINVSGNEDPEDKNHFVEEQGKIVLKLLEEKFKRNQNDVPNLFIITPFTSVKDGINKMISSSNLSNNKKVQDWLKKENIGTVHTFQGKGADEVIFVLGCDKKSTLSTIKFVKKNIVNVAVSRAKFRLYIIGDKEVWVNDPVKKARDLLEEISCDDLYKKLESVSLDDSLDESNTSNHDFDDSDFASVWL